MQEFKHIFQNMFSSENLNDLTKNHLTEEIAYKKPEVDLW